MGVELDIYSKLEPTLNNEILLKSLGYYEKKLIKHIYINIDFSLGKRTTQLFFNAVLKPKKKKLEIESNNWQYFKKNCAVVSEEFGSVDLRCK